MREYGPVETILRKYELWNKMGRAERARLVEELEEVGKPARKASRKSSATPEASTVAG